MITHVIKIHMCVSQYTIGVVYIVRINRIVEGHEIPYTSQFGFRTDCEAFTRYYSNFLQLQFSSDCCT